MSDGFEGPPSIPQSFYPSTPRFPAGQRSPWQSRPVSYGADGFPGHRRMEWKGEREQRQGKEGEERRMRKISMHRKTSEAKRAGRQKTGVLPPQKGPFQKVRFLNGAKLSSHLRRQKHSRYASIEVHEGSHCCCLSATHQLSCTVTETAELVQGDLVPNQQDKSLLNDGGGGQPAD